MHKFSNEDGAVYVDLKEIIGIEAVINEGEAACRIHLRGGGKVLVSMSSDEVHKIKSKRIKVGAAAFRASPDGGIGRHSSLSDGIQASAMRQLLPKGVRVRVPLGGLHVFFFDRFLIAFAAGGFFGNSKSPDSINCSVNNSPECRGRSRPSITRLARATVSVMRIENGRICRFSRSNNQ